MYVYIFDLETYFHYHKNINLFTLLLTFFKMLAIASIKMFNLLMSAFLKERFPTNGLVPLLR